jgi:integrase
MSLLCQRTERQKADHVANTHATHWMEKHPVEADGRTWASVTEEYLKAMSATNRRETSLADKRLKLAILGAAFSETAMKAIDKADIEAKIEELATDRGWSEGSKHAYRGAALTLLRFYSGNGKRMLIKQDDDPPATWTAAFVAKLMHAAEKVTPEIVVPLAVLLFAGCRPTEVERLTWDHIRMADKIIMLPGSLTKTRRARNVQITDNLHAPVVVQVARRHHVRNSTGSSPAPPPAPPAIRRSAPRPFRPRPRRHLSHPRQPLFESSVVVIRTPLPATLAGCAPSVTKREYQHHDTTFYLPRPRGGCNLKI